MYKGVQITITFNAVDAVKYIGKWDHVNLQHVKYIGKWDHVNLQHGWHNKEILYANSLKNKTKNWSSRFIWYLVIWHDPTHLPTH